MGMFKLIEPPNNMSLKVYGSDLHPCGIDGSVEPKIALCSTGGEREIVADGRSKGGRRGVALGEGSGDVRLLR
ncbi:hypothetical protein B296_00051911 [Ensete ventricosum]|uniref:Uncharacterized protein n=1 Tax=Ensete ventricosum TaxID=4639 RepID=A0A426WWD6_ENSVE|nr:hypothetical protein B296_00051911 [Ensete ventricosum]